MGTAKITFVHIPEYSDTIAFHCQQAVEKYIKALLIQKALDFPRTHDLPYLLEVLSSSVSIPSDLSDDAVLLNGFGVAIRYPDQIIQLSNEELEKAISIAVAFREFALSIIDVKLNRLSDPT